METARLTARVTGLSVAVALFLAGLKAWSFLEGGSTAVLASLADSGLDVLAALGSFVAVRLATAPPDEEHRFGHGKLEAFAALFQSAVVFSTAVLVGWAAARRFAVPAPVGAETGALAVMAVSFVLTALLVWAQGRVLARTASVAVTGDRAHYAADLVSNVVAIVGIGAATLTGHPRFDAAAGLFVAAWLAWGAVGVLREAADHLLDRELGADDRRAIVACVMRDPRIKGVHELRSRASGPSVMIQMHVDLDPDQSFESAHAVVDAAEHRLRAVFPDADILIHPDPLGRAEPHGPFGEEAVCDPGAVLPV